jgi:hypothetical protein
MDSPERGALMLVRFVAAALIGWAVADVALYWVVCRHNDRPLETVELLLRSLPLVAGVVLLLKAQALAEWISDLLDN